MGRPSILTSRQLGTKGTFSFYRITIGRVANEWWVNERNEKKRRGKIKKKNEDDRSIDFEWTRSSSMSIHVARRSRSFRLREYFFPFFV